MHVATVLLDRVTCDESCEIVVDPTCLTFSHLYDAVEQTWIRYYLVREEFIQLLSSDVSILIRHFTRVGSGRVRSRCLQSYHTRNVLVGKLFAKINTSEVSSTRFPKISGTESLKSFLRHVTFHALPLYTETTKVTVVFSRCLVLL